MFPAVFQTYRDSLRADWSWESCVSLLSLQRPKTIRAWTPLEGHVWFRYRRIQTDTHSLSLWSCWSWHACWSDQTLQTQQEGEPQAARSNMLTPEIPSAHQQAFCWLVVIIKSFTPNSVWFMERRGESPPHTCSINKQSLLNYCSNCSKRRVKDQMTAAVLSQ